MYGNCRKQSLIEPVLFILLNNKMSIKRVFEVDLQASHIFFSKKYKSLRLVITAGNTLSKPSRLLCWTKGQPKCRCLLDLPFYIVRTTKKKAPSMACCSDLSEPLTFNYGREYMREPSSQRECFKSFGANKGEQRK